MVYPLARMSVLQVKCWVCRKQKDARMPKLLASRSSFAIFNFFAVDFRETFFHMFVMVATSNVECSKKDVELAYLKFAGTFSA